MRRAAAAAATPHLVLPSVSAARGGRAARERRSCCGQRRKRRRRGLRAAQAETHVDPPLLPRMPLPPLQFAGETAALASAGDRGQEEEEEEAAGTCPIGARPGKSALQKCSPEPPPGKDSRKPSIGGVAMKKIRPARMDLVFCSFHDTLTPPLSLVMKRYRASELRTPHPARMSIPSLSVSTGDSRSPPQVAGPAKLTTGDRKRRRS